MKILKIHTRYGPMLHFSGEAHCQRCGKTIPPRRIACIACLPEMAPAGKKPRYAKPNPDEGGLFDGDPGVSA